MNRRSVLHILALLLMSLLFANCQAANENQPIVAGNAPVVCEKEVRQPGPYTSLIVNTLGLKVQRAMSPKICRTDGSEVWGTVNVDYDFLEDHGIVAYTRSLDDARKNERAGDNPLIIKAIGRAGGKFYCNPVVENADAKLLLDENGKSQFLDKFNVIFVVDGEI